MGWQNIVDGRGIEITLTGLTIVFLALAMIAVFLTLLPRGLKKLAEWIPEHDHHHGHPAPKPASEAAVVAALAAALHHRRTGS